MDNNKSKVYIKKDHENRITACEGGYTAGNIINNGEWIFIDEGEGDRFNLCQSNYFEGGLFTEDGICRYKYVNGNVLLRDKDETEKDREENNDEEITNYELMDILLGVSE